jgi:rhodanese-related sulfurtransferase
MRNARLVISEAALVAAVGLAVALAANAISPRGLHLGRDYFPRAEIPSAPIAAPANPINRVGTTDLPVGKEAAQQPLSPQGLQLVTSNQVVELFRDARYEQGLVVFVDARNDSLYEAGHIPGAWQFDHYHAERYLPTVLPPCLSAQQVVVYCTGSTCDDSEFAAIMLRDAGVPRENLFVYTNGITEWMTSGLPVETGARRSGQLLKPRP